MSDYQESGKGGTPISGDWHEDPHKTLIELLGTLPRIIGSSPTPIKAGSRMDGDRNTLPQSTIDLPQMCQHYISGSNDLLATLEQILPIDANHVDVPRYSAYPLIRGVIESSGQAAWVLAPNDRRERFLRLLILEKSELNYDDRYVRSSTGPLRDDDPRSVRSQVNEVSRNFARARRARWNRLLEAAEVFGIEQGEFESGLTGGYEALIYQVYNEAHLADGTQTPSECHWLGRYAASLWMFISGLSHPSKSRAWVGSQVEPGGGYVAIQTAANPDVVRNALIVALRLQMRAMVLWKKACIAP